MRQKVAFHIKGVPHYETPNPYGCDEAALAEKTRALKELAQLYPDVNPLWREWVYDVCVNTPPDQLEASEATWRACLKADFVVSTNGETTCVSNETTK